MPEIPEGYQQFEKAKTMQIGFGSKVFRADKRGIWLGAEEPQDAPFWVDMEGNMVALSLDLSGYLQVGEALTDIGAGNITGTYIANGSITTAKLIAGEIQGFTVTGGTVRTASSGTRVEMSGANNRLDVYSGSTRRMSLDGDSLEFYNSSGVKTAEMSSNDGYSLLVDGSGSSAYTVIRYNATYGLSIMAGVNAVGLFFNGGLAMQNNAEIRSYDIRPATDNSADIGTPDYAYAQGYFYDLHVLDDIELYDDLRMDNTSGQILWMNGGKIYGVDDIFLNGLSSSPTTTGQLRYYSSGSTYGLRMKIPGYTLQFQADLV